MSGLLALIKLDKYKILAKNVIKSTISKLYFFSLLKFSVSKLKAQVFRLQCSFQTVHPLQQVNTIFLNYTQLCIFAKDLYGTFSKI